VSHRRVPDKPITSGRQIVTRDTIIETLKAREPELRRLGVRHIALFGSAARGEAIEVSDIGILVDLRPDARIGVFEYVGLTQFIADLFPVPVDVANQRGSNRMSGQAPSARQSMPSDQSGD